jgi:hypothetical protein
MVKKAYLVCLVLIGDPATAQQEADFPAFSPPPDEYDWIQLTSDEWLKGELISLFDDELTFDSDNLGVIRFDWEDVRNFRGHGAYGVSLQGVEPLAGDLQIDKQQVVIVTDEKTHVYPRENLVAITPSSIRELENWSLDATVGLNIRKGNADIVEYNFMVGLERRTPNSRVIIDYLGNFNETDGQEIANNHRVTGAYDRFTGSRLFWRPLIGQFFRDPFQNIRNQGTLETGLGYELINTARTDWELFAGIGANFVRYDSVEAGQSTNSTSPALSVGTSFETEITSWMDYMFDFQATFLDDASGAYQHHLLTTLSTDLIGNFDLDVSFVWDRTQKPQPRADLSIPERDDYRIMIGVGYEF